MQFSLNGYDIERAGRAELREYLSRSASEEFREIWLATESGSAICALLNGRCGFLMFLREEGDAGFTSRDPGFAGDPESLIDYRLSNGQIDQYPAGWSLSEERVIAALEYFAEHRARPPFIDWHDDSQ